MKDSTIIRLAEIFAACWILTLYAAFKVDSVLLTLAGLLFGVSVEVLWERRRKSQ